MKVGPLTFQLHDTNEALIVDKGRRPYDNSAIFIIEDKVSGRAVTWHHQNVELGLKKIRDGFVGAAFARRYGAKALEKVNVWYAMANLGHTRVEPATIGKALGTKFITELLNPDNPTSNLHTPPAAKSSWPFR